MCKVMEVSKGIRAWQGAGAHKGTGTSCSCVPVSPQELPGCPGPLLCLAALQGLRPLLRGPSVSAPPIPELLGPCPVRGHTGDRG